MKNVVKTYQKENERGGILAEYAIAISIVTPIVIFFAFLFFQFDPDDGNKPKGLIVDRGEASIDTIRSMSPTNPSKFCTSAATEEMCM